MKKGFLFFISAFIGICVSVGLSTGCSFDNEEEFYANLACDTTNVTYTQSVKPIFVSSCTVCHSVSGGTYPDMEEYVNIQEYLDQKPGEIPARIRHVVGFNPMPEGQPKLPECDIRKIEIWIAAGYPNN